VSSEKSAQMEALISKLTSEEFELIIALAVALKYDHEHPGEDTAGYAKEKIERYIQAVE